MNVEGIPICEVCALEGRADEACTSKCKRELCERARDDHLAAAYSMDNVTCDPAATSCGFSFSKCMQYDILHGQFFKFISQGNVPYLLQVDCDAFALNATRPDGLFKYLELLDGVPGAIGDLSEVEDVVGYCHGAMGGSGGGGGMDGGETGGGPPPPQGVPEPCGPFAEQRYWVRPTNNFGTWNQSSEGVGMQDQDEYRMTVDAGGIEYTVLPCEETSARCMRIDKLSARLREAGTGFGMTVTLVEPSSMLTMSTGGRFEAPSGALLFDVRYDWDRDRAVLVRQANTQPVDGYVDVTNGSIDLPLVATSRTDGSAFLSLYGDLVNTQPVPEIAVGSGSAWNRITLRASTFDAESDPVTHSWMIPGVGTWQGDFVEVELPIGGHPVILYADDVHRARGVTAQWVEISSGGL